jgi:hypothetical protein
MCLSSMNHQWIRYVSTNATSIRIQATPWSIAAPANTIKESIKGWVFFFFYLIPGYSIILIKGIYSFKEETENKVEI